MYFCEAAVMIARAFASKQTGHVSKKIKKLVRNQAKILPMEAGKNVFLAPASTSTSYRPSLPNVCTLAHVIWPSERATTTISPFLKELVGEKLKSSDSRQPCGGHTCTHTLIR